MPTPFPSADPTGTPQYPPDIEPFEDEEGTWQVAGPDVRPRLERNARVQPVLREWVLRLLSGAPEERGTVAQFAEALEAEAAPAATAPVEPPAPPRPLARARARSPWLALAVVAALGPNEVITRQMRKGAYLAKVWNGGVGAKIDSGVTLTYRNRKTDQNRGNVVLHESMCLVFGIRTAPNTWDFFFHAAGVVDYTRPGLLSNRTGYLKSIIPWQQL